MAGSKFLFDQDFWIDVANIDIGDGCCTQLMFVTSHMEKIANLLPNYGLFLIFLTQSCPVSDHFKDSVFGYVLCKRISMQVQMQVLKKNKFDLTLRLFYFTSWLINSLNFSDIIQFLAERLRHPRWVLSYAIGAIVEVKYKLFGQKTGDFKKKFKSMNVFSIDLVVKRYFIESFPSVSFQQILNFFWPDRKWTVPEVIL